MASGWFLLFIYQNYARSNKHQIESRDLTAANNRARYKIIPALSLCIIFYLPCKPVCYDILALVSLGE